MPGVAGKLNDYSVGGVKELNLMKDFGLSQKQIIPSRGNSIANALYSKSELASEIAHRVHALGPIKGGIQMLDEDGEPLKNHRFYSHELKKWVTTDDKGRVMMGNKSVVDQAYELYVEKEKLISEHAQKCVVNDEICAYILGFKSVAELRERLGKDNGFEVDGSPMTDEDLIKIDAMPSSMKRYAHGQPSRLLAVQKLRLLIGERLNHINLIDFGDKRSDVHNDNVQMDVPNEFSMDGKLSVGNFARGRVATPAPEETS